jgi:cytidyltransferase-like protein
MAEMWREEDLEEFYEQMRRLDLSKKRLVLTSGYFNPIHAGHVRLIRRAKNYDSILVVAVNGDVASVRKNGYSFMPIDQRMEIISELNGVDYVIETNDDTMMSVLYNLKPYVFAKGGDVTKETFNPGEKAVCDDLGIYVAFGVGGGKYESSSNLLQKYIENWQINDRN